MPKEHILIISYQFCPRGRVGTRRWSKFAKFLSRDNNVHVIAAEYPYKDKVNWCKDVENNENIFIHRISGMFPSGALSENRTFIVKTLHHLLIALIYYKDEAQHWCKRLHIKVDELRQEHGITTIIVTGAPFSPMHHMAIYKKDNPEINLILDFRDPWMQLLPKSYTFFSDYKRNKEREMEKEVMNLADTVLVVSDSMKSAYCNAYPEHAEKTHTLFNGFDPDDYRQFSPRQLYSHEGGTIKIAYAGALFIDRAKGLESLIRQLEKDLQDSAINIKLTIYSGQVDNGFKKFVLSLSRVQVDLNSPLPQNELFAELINHDYLLSINAPNAHFAFGSKIFEYIALRSKIILISPKGELHSLLSKNGMLVADYTKNELKKLSRRIITENTDSLELVFENLYKQFNLSRLTTELNNYINLQLNEIT